MHLSLLRAVLVACLISFFSTQAAAQDANAERLRIHGSNTLGARLVPALVQSWLSAIGYEDITRRQRGPEVLEIRAERDGEPLIVEIVKRGSASGMNDLAEGNAELAMMSRLPNATEIDAAWQLGDLNSPDQEFVIALDGVAAIVHGGNPVRQISVEQLRGIYSGQITNWSQLGGPSRPIRVLLSGADTAAGEFFRARVLEGGVVAAHAEAARSSADAGAKTARDPSAIAIVSLRDRIARSTRPLAISDGGAALLPTRINILSEDYPLVRRYSLYGAQLMSALGRSFALYTVTRDAQQVVRKSGHIAVTLRPAPQQPLPPAEAAYRERVYGAERLPVSLRFNPGGLESIFDSRAVRDLDRVVKFFQLPQNQGKQALVVAFGSHDPGGALVSTMVSNDRADLIADYLQSHGIVVRSSAGMGASRLLAAPSGARGNFFNERVEVWMR